MGGVEEVNGGEYKKSGRQTPCGVERERKLESSLKTTQPQCLDPLFGCSFRIWISFGTPPSTDDQAHVTDIISPRFSLFFFVELDAWRGSGGATTAVVTSSGGGYQKGRRK
uniref:Uncharacterized protein n=1 Tax=Nelumbo nucifera TaxID=4432 RepID=A0A822XHR3_NELNU|nr:TPA_asm: hypothetical protein HUJ06_021240 [Nelumbo nucifera]